VPFPYHQPEQHTMAHFLNCFIVALHNNAYNHPNARFLLNLHRKLPVVLYFFQSAQQTLAFSLTHVKVKLQTMVPFFVYVLFKIINLFNLFSQN
jgi:hypothetical protein